MHHVQLIAAPLRKGPNPRQHYGVGCDHQARLGLDYVSRNNRFCAFAQAHVIAQFGLRSQNEVSGADDLIREQRIPAAGAPVGLERPQQLGWYAILDLVWIDRRAESCRVLGRMQIRLDGRVRVRQQPGPFRVLGVADPLVRVIEPTMSDRKVRVAVPDVGAAVVGDLVSHLWAPFLQVQGSAKPR